jgi:hypothetical protein
MARTFGEKGDDNERDDSKGACGGSPAKPVSVPSSPIPIEEEQTQAQAQPVPEEIRNEAEQGQHLYLEFVLGEIMRLGLATPAIARQLHEADDQLLTHLTPDRVLDWSRAGRELRQVADAFARSKERQYIRQRAQSVDLESITLDNFLQLLQELFQGGGITRERILVLFFFCADVTIEAIKRGFNRTFRHLMEWSLRYITTRVAQWVHNHGGWSAVLSSSLNVACQVTACLAFISIAVACAIYIRRNI